tara:strand:- start:131750 stop:132664 length:915 start_codon:yes stop_codon:yes gene_type:complete
MGTARRRWSPDEKKTAIRLSEEGYTHKQIAERLRPGVSSAWRSVGDIIREDRAAKTAPPAPAPQAAPTVNPHQIVTTIPKSALVVLPPEMASSLSAQEFMTMMNDDQRKIFIGHYMDLRGNVDEESLTTAENEMLIRASYSNVKYLNAQSMLMLSESYLMLEMEGGMTDSDEDKAKKRFAGRGDSYKKEADQWQKEYMDYLDGLKLTRKQRLDKIKDTRNTFLDLQLELTNQIRRESLVEEIKRINMATEAEFRRMAKGEPGPDGQTHSWLIGAFDDYLTESSEEPQPTKQLDKKEDINDEHST